MHVNSHVVLSLSAGVCELHKRQRGSIQLMSHVLCCGTPVQLHIIIVCIWAVNRSY